MALTFEEALLTNADGSPRTLFDIDEENAVRDEAKVQSVTGDHLARADAAVSGLQAAAAGFRVGSLGVDFSWQKPLPTELAGHDFVMPYLPYPGDSGKSCDRAQVQSYLAKGKVAVALWEVAAGDCLRGYDVGVAHGTQARISAYDTWGLPVPGSVIVVACDTDTTYAACKPYLDGFDSAIQGYYRLGVYGGIRVTDPAVDDGVIGFQTVAWSGGQVGKGHVLQNGFNYYPNGTKANCDKDVILRTPVGGWGEDGLIPQGDWLEMATKEEVDALLDAKFRYFLPRLLDTLVQGTPNEAFGPGSTVAVDNRGVQGFLRRTASVLRNGKPNSSYPPGSSDAVDNVGIDGKIKAAVAAVQLEQVDVQALAVALAPLIEHGATAEELRELLERATFSGSVVVPAPPV